VAMESDGPPGVKHQLLRGPLSERISLQQQAMGVVDKAAQHGIGDGWVADHLMPVIDRQLACDDGRAAFVAVVHDLQQVLALFGGERGRAPVVEDQQLHPADRLQQPSVAPVAARQGQRPNSRGTQW
jgi:hypothetical protein